MKILKLFRIFDVWDMLVLLKYDMLGITLNLVNLKM
jgi:hypothetical protein